jgi:hypothetical protein
MNCKEPQTGAFVRFLQQSICDTQQLKILHSVVGMAAGTFTVQRQSTVGIGRTVVIQMIRPSRIVMMAAFSLLSVLTAQAATAPTTIITSAPTGGIYIMPFYGPPFTTPPDSPPGTIVLDLKGHTIKGPNGGKGIFMQNSSQRNLVTVKNGKIQNFEYGLAAAEGWGGTSRLYYSSRSDI